MNNSSNVSEKKIDIYKIKDIDDFLDELDKISESCKHEDKIYKENGGIRFTICNKCGLALSSTEL